MTFMFLLVGTVCVLGAYFAPEIVVAIAPGFRADTEKLALTVLLTRIMFPFLLFVSLAAIVMGALNTRRVFFVRNMAEAVEQGAAYKALHKPWDDDALPDTIREAFGVYAQDAEVRGEMPICGGKLACHDLGCGRRLQ